VPKLYLIPSLLAEDGVEHVPPIVVERLTDLDTFIVEGLRSTRRFIKKLIPDYDIDGSTFIEMDKHDPQATVQEVAELLKLKKDIGLLSEAGCPCLADPGHPFVDQARNKGYTIMPLTGPTSIVLALIASGCNGQQFTFHGYLPVKDHLLIPKLKLLEADFRKTGYTQIWIETPYRNDKMITAAHKAITPDAQLTVAS